VPESLASLLQTGAARHVRDEVLPRVAAFRALQRPDGTVAGPTGTASDLLDRLVPAVRRAAELTGVAGIGEAFALDTRDWQARGLDQPPAYDRSLRVYRPPAGDGLTFFAAPLVATNGPAPRGHFMECFLAHREEPDECRRLERSHPHPKNKCQSMRMVRASRGFEEGNCIVFFPENVASSSKVEHQDYALFFFNKFQDIYLTLTMPVVERIFGEHDLVTGEDRWRSAAMEASDCYRARCVWGYLHDYFHHIGPRPLDENLRVKLNWFVGVLEEIKVDCQTMLACLEPDVPFGTEVFEFALFERMLRYPQQPDWATNFDAGTGVLLFEWLRRQGALALDGGPRLRFDRASLTGALTGLIERIVELEREPDDAAYRARAKEFVRGMLPAPPEAGPRFTMPEGYRTLVDVTPADVDLTFTALAY
jgi:hypothetical protein